MAFVRAIASFVVVSSALAASLPGLAASFPFGDYEAHGITLQFDASGAYRLLQGGKALIEGTYESDAATLSLTDVSGPFACPAAQKRGTYSWRFDGKELVLTRADDNCEGRAGDLTTHPWRKR